MDNFILNKIILFILYYFFCFIIPMMLWLGILLRFYVVIEPIIVWQVDQPILLFIMLL